MRCDIFRAPEPKTVALPSKGACGTPSSTCLGALFTFNIRNSQASGFLLCSAERAAMTYTCLVAPVCYSAAVW